MNPNTNKDQNQTTSLFKEITDIPPIPQENNSSAQQASQLNQVVGKAAGKNTDQNHNSIKSRKKMVATIFGVLLLVSAVGIGVALVRQNQNIKEKAAEVKCRDITSRSTCNSSCSPPKSDGKRYACKWICPSGEGCKCIESGNECNPDGGGGGGIVGGKSCTRVNEKCFNCRTGNGLAYHYKCDKNTLSGGCQDNERLIGNLTAGTHEFCFDGGLNACGSEQIDFPPPSGNNSDSGFISRYGPEPCKKEGPTPTPTPTRAPSPTPTPTRAPSPTPTPTLPPRDIPRCLGIKTYDTNWNLITASQLSQLRPGERVRFAVSGTPADQIDMARFTINGGTPQITRNKKPGTDEFYIEYTIPTGVTTFSVKAELHHIELGWF